MAKHCENCIHVQAQVQKDENGKIMIGKNTYVCIAMPPKVVAIPNAQGMALMSCFPQVNRAMVCHLHRSPDAEPFEIVPDA